MHRCPSIRLAALFALLALLLALGPPVGRAAPDIGPEFRALAALPHVRVELRYASADNFMGENLYGEFRTAYLHRDAYAKLERASVRLQAERPGWKLLVFDALRPRSVQRRLFEKVRGTPRQRYVAPPEPGSVHNFGLAVDLSLQDGEGREVDMGTPYDEFTERAQPRHEERLLRSGELTAPQVAHRRLLRRVMEQAGFRPLAIEWWHFDALPGAEVRARYRIVE